MDQLRVTHFRGKVKMTKFICVGVLNTLVGYGIFAVLIVINVPYAAALLMATVAGVISNYFNTGRLVFQSHGGLIIFIKFITAYGIVYISNVVGLELAINCLKVGPYLGQALCIPPSVLSSWLLMNYWVFRSQ